MQFNMYFTFCEKGFIIRIDPRERVNFRETKEKRRKEMKKLSVMLESYYHMFG